MNISYLLKIFWVLKLDKSIDDNELQLENIDSILVTFWGLKLDKSIDVNE